MKFFNTTFRFGGQMNTIVTSKEEILRISRELIRQQGCSAISIRSVAAACGVSVGSIYNYFDSKAAMVGAAVESISLVLLLIQIKHSVKGGLSS